MIRGRSDQTPRSRWIRDGNCTRRGNK